MIKKSKELVTKLTYFEPTCNICQIAIYFATLWYSANKPGYEGNSYRDHSKMISPQKCRFLDPLLPLANFFLLPLPPCNRAKSDKPYKRQTIRYILLLILLISRWLKRQISTTFEIQCTKTK